MKSFFLITITLLAAALSVSAFSPSYSSRRSISSLISNTKLCMARRKPAKSQEEDLELTRAIIMKHIGSMDDDGFVVDDSDDSDVEDSDTSSADASEAASTGKKLGDKLKDKGRKIKNKLKSKMMKKK